MTGSSIVRLRVWIAMASSFVYPLSAGAQAARAKVAAPTDSDAVARAFVAAEDAAAYQRLRQARTQYLRGAAWADLGARCNPGSLRIFPADTTAQARDSVQQLVERMEQQVVLRGVGAKLDTPDARRLLRVIVGWEAGIDRPIWDTERAGPPRVAVATGLTGEVPDPEGPGCLPSPIASDTVLFVIPGFTGMDFPKAPSPRVMAYFGPAGQVRARDEFFARVGRTNPDAALAYIVVAPIVIWRDYAVVGVHRPVERGGVEIGRESRGGAAYLMRRVGSEWRLLAIVRSWGG
ncbi:MAG: hypothetical protein ACK6DP_02905 [Gemmatimonas sp.]|jgi:hypothetical protein|uniref:hypothetical protein n=1 Tax=Gemmatimonas sp. TaxID=1962908 RepID=UPI00391F3B57|nr:hypothetical protein [Gemmatimonadota bacterium]